MDWRSLNRTHIFYTVCIFLNHLAFGITSTVIWPTLVDLSYIYSCSNATINYLMTFSSLGYLIGSLSGWLYGWLNRQLTIVLMVTLISATTVAIPFYGKLWLLFLGVTLNGIGGGTWDSNNNVWLVEMWPTSNAPIIQASQFMYGVGNIIGPSLVSPFVHGDNDDDNGTDITTTMLPSLLITTNTTEDPTNITYHQRNHWTPEERKHELLLPFSITATIQFVVPVILAIMFVVRRYRPPLSPSSSQQQPINIVPNETSRLHVPSPEQYNTSDDGGVGPDHDHHRNGGLSNNSTIITSTTTTSATISHRGAKLILMAFCLALYDAAEIGYFYFAASAWYFLTKNTTNPIESDESSRLTSVLSGAYTLGRLVTAFITIKLKPDHVITYHYLVVIGAQILLYTCWQTNHAIIYGGTFLLGYGFSAMWPAMLAFTDRHLRLTNRAGSLLFTFAGLVSIMTPFIIGPFLADTPSVLFVFTTAYTLFSMVLYLTLRLWIVRCDLRLLFVN